jgi:hypothetical protein
MPIQRCFAATKGNADIPKSSCDERSPRQAAGGIASVASTHTVLATPCNCMLGASHSAATQGQSERLPARSISSVAIAYAVSFQLVVAQVQALQRRGRHKVGAKHSGPVSLKVFEVHGQALQNAARLGPSAAAPSALKLMWLSLRF